MVIQMEIPNRWNRSIYSGNYDFSLLYLSPLLISIETWFLPNFFLKSNLFKLLITLMLFRVFPIWLDDTWLDNCFNISISLLLKLFSPFDENCLFSQHFLSISSHRKTVFIVKLIWSDLLQSRFREYLMLIELKCLLYYYYILLLCFNNIIINYLWLWFNFLMFFAEVAWFDRIFL